MSYFGNNGKGEEDIDEVVKLLLDRKEINQKQRDTFHRASYLDIIRKSAEILDKPYRDDTFTVSGQIPTLAAAIPTITTGIIEKAPRFFDSAVGVDIPIEVFSYEHPKSKNVTLDTISSEEKLRLTRIKHIFNYSLDERIRRATTFFHSSTDMDILGRADNLEPLLREIYQSIGSSRLDALEHAVKNNKADANVFLKVTNPEGGGTYYAKEPAIKLLKIGVKVWDYDGGEKCGALKTFEVLPDHRQKLQKLLTNGNLKKISEGAVVDKKTLERWGRGDERELSFRDLEALQGYFRQQIDEGSPLYEQTRLVREKPYVFTISRVFAEGERQQATNPQVHTRFSGIIMSWPKAYDFWENHFVARKTPEREITLDSPVLKAPTY